MAMRKKTFLITGGTGSFGRAYGEFLLKKEIAHQVTIFSRDEQKHYQLMREWHSFGDKVQFFLGDLRDYGRVKEATEKVDYVIHCAAMKHMPMAEMYVEEAIKTNILGSQNLIKACVENGVERVVALSTDKAVMPINVYGATKLLLERLFVSADANKHNDHTRFSVVRYANVFGSKGSVVPLFLELRKSGMLPITHPEMSRFSITMPQGIDLVEFALHNALGGEVVVPIVPSYRVKDIADAICEPCEKKIIGARTAEKMHEQLIAAHEVPQVVQVDGYYLVSPVNGRNTKEDYLEKLNATVPDNMHGYSSDKNTKWLSTGDIRDLLHQIK